MKAKVSPVNSVYVYTAFQKRTLNKTTHYELTHFSNDLFVYKSLKSQHELIETDTKQSILIAIEVH